MTKDEILKAAKACAEGSCTQCPYFREEDMFCNVDNPEELLSLIASQQKEIERWKKELKSSNADKANEIIFNWCKEHPVKTRQDKLLELFPNTMKDEDVINIDPCVVDETLHLASPYWGCAKKSNVEDCEECRRKYWLAEVEE